MAIRKDVTEEFVVDGPRQRWLPKVQVALETSGFKNVRSNHELHQVTADYQKATTWGTLKVTLTPEAAGTRIVALATGNVDNAFALFKSPGKTILERFKQAIAS